MCVFFFFNLWPRCRATYSFYIYFVTLAIHASFISLSHGICQTKMPQLPGGSEYFADMLTADNKPSLLGDGWDAGPRELPLACECFYDSDSSFSLELSFCFFNPLVKASVRIISFSSALLLETSDLEKLSGHGQVSEWTLVGAVMRDEQHVIMSVTLEQVPQLYLPVRLQRTSMTSPAPDAET